jgi:type I restriction enzyme S subunit
LGGGTPRTSESEYWNGTIPWFSVADSPSESDVWVVETAKHITEEGLRNSAAQILPLGVTIITARGPVGQVALVGMPMAMNQSCYGLQGKAGGKGYFFYFATLNLVTDLHRHSHGAVFDTITRDTFQSVNLVMPRTELVHAFDRQVAPLVERIRENVLESRSLSKVRDALLPKLISGEIRVDLTRHVLARS